MLKQEMTMGQQLQTWQSKGGDRLWLSMLIDAMEEVSRPETRLNPCDPFVLAAVRAQLSRPASGFAHCGSVFSLRN